MDDLRLAVIGLGNMGSHHARLLDSGQITGARLAAVCDIDPTRLEPWPACTHFSSSAELIASDQIDAVLIATPHYDHTISGEAALQAGLHVLVEKPISVHKADAERLIAAWHGLPQIFAAMFNQRTDPHFTQLKRLIDSGELGHIQRVQWTITNWYRTNLYYASSAWRATWAGEGGGVLLNQCPHNLDLWQWLFGQPQRVRAWCGYGKHHPIEVEDEVTAYLEYDDGLTGVFISSTGEAPGTNRLEIAADRGSVLVEDGRIQFARNVEPTSEFTRAATEIWCQPEVWQVQIPAEGVGPQHQGILQNFVDAIRLGTSLIAPATEGLHSVELANAMLLSSARQATIDLPLDADDYAAWLQSMIDGSAGKQLATPVGLGPQDPSVSFGKI